MVLPLGLHLSPRTMASCPGPSLIDQAICSDCHQPRAVWADCLLWVLSLQAQSFFLVPVSLPISSPEASVQNNSSAWSNAPHSVHLPATFMLQDLAQGVLYEATSLMVLAGRYESVPVVCAPVPPGPSSPSSSRGCSLLGPMCLSRQPGDTPRASLVLSWGHHS